MKLENSLLNASRHFARYLMNYRVYSSNMLLPLRHRNILNGKLLENSKENLRESNLLEKKVYLK